MIRIFAGTRSTLLSTALCVSFAVAAFGQQDPPSRVARLNYINGNVSMEPAGIDDWAPAVINRPFTTGDYLYADQKAVAELHMDVAAIRLGELTSFGFLNLDDQVAQLKLTEGDMYFRIHNLDGNQTFEVDTPNAAINLLRDGVYRIHVDPNANTTFVVVRDGQAEVSGGGQAFTVDAGNGASLSGTDQLAYNVENAPAPDVFDNWCEQRDAHEDRSQSARYLPPTVIGSEDLDDNGVWSETPDYGPLWYPRSVDAGWAPYHNGHWAWIEPWGWTWVDDAPWGFAPFHYGRWVYWHERWGWAPGPIAVVGIGRPIVRPIYSPALVAWFGGSHWGASISLGGGPSLGWVALGFGEVFTPHYACSRQYFSNVNIHNTRIERNVNITNVYNTVYVNHTVYNQKFVNVRSPNAVIAMPRNAFANGRSVRQAGTPVRPNQIARFRPAESAIIAPGVAPTREAVAPTLGRQAGHPPAQIAQRQVLARTAPPPAPVSFASRQQYLDQHAGQPHNFAAMHQTVAPQTRQVASVRQLPPEQPIAGRPGRSVEHTPPAPALARQSGGIPQANRPNTQPQEYSRPQRPGSPQSSFEREPHQVPEARPAHGAPPNLHNGYNSQAAPRTAPGPAPVQPSYPNRANERTQPQPGYSRPETRAPAPAARPERNQESVPPHVSAQPRQNEQPHQNEQPRYNAPPSPQAPEQARPAQQPRYTAQPREQRPVERSQPEVHQQPRTESHPAEQPHHEARPENRHESSKDDKK